jgi:hypothetical protein
MSRLLRWYGANPLHLLALLACFSLAGYAAVQFVGSRPLAVAVWFLGAVIGHDLLLMPLYSLADRSVLAAIRHRAPSLPAIPWINYIRVPAALSALLLLLWLPLIFRLTASYHASTTLSPSPYVWHWLAVTGALFLLSTVLFALRLRGRPGPDQKPLPAHPADDPEAEEPPGERIPAEAPTTYEANKSSVPGPEQPAAEDSGAPGPASYSAPDGGQEPQRPAPDDGREAGEHSASPTRAERPSRPGAAPSPGTGPKQVIKEDPADQNVADPAAE